MKKNRFSDCRPSFFCAAVVAVLAGLVLGLVAFANETHEEDELTSTSPITSNGDSQGEEDEATPADEEVIQQLLKFQKMLEDNNEVDNSYDDDERCVDTRRVRYYDVLSGRFVAFKMRVSDEIYLVQFEQKCPGLHKDGRLKFDLRSGQSGRLCANDTIQPLDIELSTQRMAGGGSCRIPIFEKITEVQLLQLERGLASNRVQ